MKEIPFDLNVETPDMWFCKIWEYVAGHQRLTVLLQHIELPTKRCSILFNHVLYFTGPTLWHGAAWTMRSLTESDLPLFRTIIPYNEFKEESIIDQMSSYTMFTIEHSKLYILANAAEKGGDPLVRWQRDFPYDQSNI